MRTKAQSFPALIPWKQTLLPVEIVGLLSHSWLRGEFLIQFFYSKALY